MIGVFFGPLRFTMESTPSGAPSHGKNRQKFVKMHLDELDNLFLLLSFKNIRSIDVCVLLAYASFTDPRTGRCRAVAEKIANKLSIKQSNVYLSVKRLREAQLLVRITDKRTGEIIHLVNPYLFSGGSLQQRGLMIKTYAEAIHKEYED